MSPAPNDHDRIERLRQFEELKSAVAAAQFSEAARLDVSQRAEQAVAGEPAARQGRGIAAQVGLALRVSPWQATRWLGWAKNVTRELPATLAALRAGVTTERRALLVARETVWLSRQDRAEVDALVGPELHRLGDARIEAGARRHAYRLDPAGVAERRRVAVGVCRVMIRARPDVMSALTATVPVAQGVAAWAALRRHADTLVGTGQADGRTRDQVMADTLIERLTGQAVADGVGTDVEVLITTDTLLGTGTLLNSHIDIEIDTDIGPVDHSDEPARLMADGIAPIPIPADLARELIADAPTAELRRLFTTPKRRHLVAMDSTARHFPEALRDLIRHRDQYCSTSYCGAPIRHIDHARPHERGGRTNAVHGNGRCAACNFAKQAPGWTQTPGPRGGDGTITTPTGHV